MGQRYADRAFISINGTQILDLQNASLRQNNNARVVPSMTNNGRNRGYVQGNRDIDITAVIAVENALTRPKLENIDYENNDIQITFRVGADVYVATGIFNKDAEDNAGGVGEEVKTTFNFGALDVKDTEGNSVLFDIGL